VHATSVAQLYDSFTGPELDTARWRHLEYPMPDGPSWVCAEPHARTSVADGALTVEIDRFELEHPAQLIDNCKHVLLSTESFRLPDSGTMTIAADVTATSVNATPHEHRDGFASLIVIEVSTGLVFDLAATSDRVFAIHERLPVSDAMPCFTRIVDDPLAGLASGPATVHHCSITFDTAARTVRWMVDDTLLFDAAGVQMPQEINVGLGIFTLHPVGAHGSRSLHGQGMHATWRDVRVSVQP
jgi:Family of unknown function (DUF6081)